MKNTVISVLIMLTILVSVALAHATDSDTGETPEIQYNTISAPDLSAKTAVLASPVKIYEYLRNNAEFALYHGSRSGSINSFLGLRGNDVDLASTLIAMYRSRGYHARYSVGTVRVAADQVMNWLGVKNLDLAVSLMKDQGIQNVILSADRAYVDFEHVWVEAQIPYGNYRGAGQDAASVICNASTTCNWVALDPSFKLKQYNDQGINVYTGVQFDYTSYYNAIKNNDPKFRDKNPLEIYENQVLAYLQTNYPGKTLEDASYTGDIIVQDNLILPASLPYTVVGTPRHYNSIADHDAAVGVSNPDKKNWKKNISIKFTYHLASADVANIPGGSYSLVDASTKRLTVSYDSAIGGLVVKIDNNTVFTVVDIYNHPISIPAGTPFDMILTMDGVPGITQTGTDTQITTTNSNCVSGGHQRQHRCAVC